MQTRTHAGEKLHFLFQTSAFSLTNRLHGFKVLSLWNCMYFKLRDQHKQQLNKDEECDDVQSLKQAILRQSY